jgi:hypothetical protein
LALIAFAALPTGEEDVPVSPIRPRQGEALMIRATSYARRSPGSRRQLEPLKTEGT